MYFLLDVYSDLEEEELEGLLEAESIHHSLPEDEIVNPKITTSLGKRKSDSNMPNYAYLNKVGTTFTK